MNDLPYKYIKNNIKIENINKIIKKSYIDYASFVITERTLPDIRDGLKPVHRRIIFAMYQLNNFYNKPYKKSARIVGDVIGKYHPHGDISVYKAIIKMTQKFITRYPLIEGQGNFGSIDKDPAAAMRYTEIRLSKICNELIQELNFNSEDFIKNYDESEYMPNVLPNKFPNILVNGSTGIAVGMKTNIPPHNLSEIIFASIEYLKDNNISIKKILSYIKGPDFPSGGIIINKNELENIYSNGFGTIKIQANIIIEKNKIIITELPFQINKNTIIFKILSLIKKKKIEINKIHDDSCKNEIKIILYLNKNTNIENIIKILFKHTQLQNNFNVNMIAISDHKPKLFNIKNIIIEFINHRRKKIIENKKNEILKINQNIDKYICSIIFFKNIKQIINIIQSNNNIINELKKLIINKQVFENEYIFDKICNTQHNFQLNENQINIIIKQKLINIKILSINNIINKLLLEIKKKEEIEKLLNNIIFIDKIIIKELLEINKKFKDKRKTIIL